MISKKKKKGLHRFWDWFFGQKRKFKRFFRPISGDLQKKKRKRSSPILRLVFRPISENQMFEGGLFSIFHQKSASKAPKTCDFAYFTSQWGGPNPPAPLATLLVVVQYIMHYCPLIGTLSNIWYQAVRGRYTGWSSDTALLIVVVQ